MVSIPKTVANADDRFCSIIELPEGKHMMSIFGKIARYLVLAVSSILIVALLFAFYRWAKALDPQGEENACCIKMDLPPVSNGAGMLASAHNTGCDCVMAHSIATYVYVHPSGSGDSRKSLVFRYEGGDDDPQLTWVDRSTLHIAVGHIAEVSKQVDSIDGVKITYSIGMEYYPRKQGHRFINFRTGIGVFMFLALLALIFVAGVTVRSILRSRHGTGAESLGGQS